MSKKPSQKKKMPPKRKSFSLEFFQKAGAQGGLIGGKKAAQQMTAAERSARAKKAVDAREAKRKPLAKKNHQ